LVSEYFTTTLDMKILVEVVAAGGGGITFLSMFLYMGLSGTTCFSVSGQGIGCFFDFFFFLFG